MTTIPIRGLLTTLAIALAFSFAPSISADARERPSPAPADQLAANATDPGDAAQLERLHQGRELLDGGHPSDALSRYFDPVIAHYEETFGDSSQQIYCSRYLPETLAYLTSAAAKGRDARVLGPAWSDAYFLKGFALIELGRVPEAKVAIGRAIELSPGNAQYLSELGYLHQQERDWTRAMASYDAAVEAAGYVTDKAEEVAQRTRALRGQGFVLVELGKLREAEAKYRECLRLNPDDAVAKSELNYVQQLRGKQHQ